MINLNAKIELNKKKQEIINNIQKQKDNKLKLQNFNRKNQPYPLKESYNSIIPKKVFTHWHTSDLPPKMKENYEYLKLMNPEMEHILFNDNDCVKFIANNFGIEVLNAYNSLIPSAFKSDLFRYCLLYKVGGIYIDIKYKTVNGFKLIALTEKEYFVRDLESSFKGIYNALIVSLPNNPILLNCINQIVLNVKNKYYGNNVLDPTGPSLLKRYFTEQMRNNLELYLEVCNVDNVINTFYICHNNYIILGKYKEYYDEQKSHQKELRYCDLWDNRNIYR